MLDVLNIWKQEAGTEVMSPFQEEVIRHVMRRRDAVVVMPRGEARALCFQVPAMLMKGLVVVISPRCRERMVNRKLLYVRPNRLSRALAWLQGREVGLFVVDEAQCMGEWRKDYVRDYARLGQLRWLFPGVPIVAMTGESGDMMRIYLSSQLWLRGWAVFEDASGRGESYMARQKRLHKNAYAKWSREDDRTLLAMYEAGGTVKAIASFFGRNEGAIRSRMKKLTERTLSL